MSRDSTSVTVVGLGEMGSALAEAFLAAGYQTIVWNRSTGKDDDLIARGAVAAGTVNEAVANSPLTIISLLDYEAVREVLSVAGDSMRGKAIVNLTTGTPDQAREAAKWVSEHGAAYLDGGVLGDPSQVGTPAMRFYFSGERRAFGDYGETLKVMGEDAAYYGEDAGVASVYYMALVGMSYEVWISYLHTLAFVESEGVEVTNFAPVANSVLTPTLELLNEFARATDAKDYPPVAGSLVTHAALMDDLIDTWRVRGVDIERLKHVKDLMNQRIAEEHGGDGFSSVFEAVRLPSA